MCTKAAEILCWMRGFPVPSANFDFGTAHPQSALPSGCRCKPGGDTAVTRAYSDRAVPQSIDTSDHCAMGVMTVAAH
jgi:hypothetical protein